MELHLSHNYIAMQLMDSSDLHAQKQLMDRPDLHAQKMPCRCPKKAIMKKANNGKDALFYVTVNWENLASGALPPGPRKRGGSPPFIPPQKDMGSKRIDRKVQNINLFCTFVVTTLTTCTLR